LAAKTIWLTPDLVENITKPAVNQADSAFSKAMEADK